MFGGWRASRPNRQAFAGDREGFRSALNDWRGGRSAPMGQGASPQQMPPQQGGYSPGAAPAAASPAPGAAPASGIGTWNPYNRPTHAMPPPYSGGTPASFGSPSGFASGGMMPASGGATSGGWGGMSAPALGSMPQPGFGTMPGVTVPGQGTTELGVPTDKYDAYGYLIV